MTGGLEKRWLNSIFNNGIFGFSDEDNDRHVPLFECKRIEVIGNIFEGLDK
jgi:hypothetical protein